MSIIVLGLDSARKTGYGLLERDGPKERLIDFGMVDLGKSGVGRAARVKDFVARMRAHGRIDLVGIEDNYLETDEERSNVVTLKALARTVGRWEQAWEAYGIDTELVMAQKWQTGLLTGLMGPRSNRATRKAACAMWVKATFKLSPGEDECDGIAIATYLARQRAFATRVAS